MKDILSKEQIVLLQKNLTYEVYDKFMSMTPKNNKNIISYIKYNFNIFKQTDIYKSLVDYIYTLIQSILALLLIVFLSLLICFFKDNENINVNEFIYYVNSTIKFDLSLL